jgi:hypothetical protein
MEYKSTSNISVEDGNRSFHPPQSVRMAPVVRKDVAGGVAHFLR